MQLYGSLDILRHCPSLGLEWTLSFSSPVERVTGRKVRGPEVAGGNKLQVADVSFLLYRKLKEASFNSVLGHLVLPWANHFHFLMEMFFLSYGNETMYLLWNLPFFKMVPPKTKFFPFLKPWSDNGSTNQYSCQLRYCRGWHTSCHPISKMHTVGEGPGETPSALRCLSYLINSLQTDIKPLAKN